MKIPASRVAELIESTVVGMRDAMCALAKKGITIQYDDEIVLELEIVPDDGFNAITRTSQDNAGTKVSIESKPASVITTVEDAYTVVQIDGKAEVTRTETRTGTETTRTERRDPSTRTTEQTQDAQNSTRTSEATVHSENGQDNRGGDTVIQEYEVESS